MLGNLIGGFVVIIVGVTLVPIVADSVSGSQFQDNGTGNGTSFIATNVTGAASTIVGLTTLFFVLGVTGAGIAIAAQGLRSAGLLG